MDICKLKIQLLHILSFMCYSLRKHIVFYDHSSNFQYKIDAFFSQGNFPLEENKITFLTVKADAGHLLHCILID